MKFLILILTIPVFIWSACQDTTEKQNHTLSVKDKIDSLMQSQFEQGKFNGTILVADSNGIIYDNAFGWADKKEGDTLTTQTVFYMGSVAKQFTAMSLMLLKHEGKVKFDESIRKYFPELPQLMDEITLSHMLTHTSGLPDYYDLGKFKPGFTNEDVLEVAKEIDSLEFEPGSQYAYSNTAYVLLSMLVERISGQSWRNFLEKQIFAPLEMNYSEVYDQTEPALPHRAKGHSQNGSLDDYQAFTTGGGGIFSNIYDIYLWDQALYTDRLLGQHDISQAYNPTQLNDGKISYYGWGWMLDKDNPNIVFHSGSLAGYRTYIYRDLGKRFTIIVLSNFTNDAAEIKDQLLGVFQGL